jgi:hypothetical protein
MLDLQLWRSVGGADTLTKVLIVLGVVGISLILIAWFDDMYDPDWDEDEDEDEDQP